MKRKDEDEEKKRREKNDEKEKENDNFSKMIHEEFVNIELIVLLVD